MKYKQLVIQQIETLSEKCSHLINAINSNKLTSEELIRQIDMIKRGLERINDEVENEENPPANFS